MKSSTIEALQYLRSLPGDGFKNAIRETCRKESLNEEFVNEFRQYIDKEMFTNSPLLSYKMIEEYPDLFSKEMWDANSNKSLAPLEDADFRSMFSNKEICGFIASANPREITNSLMAELFKINNGDIKEELMKKYPGEYDADFLIKNSSYITPGFFSNPKHTANLTIKDIESILKAYPKSIKFFSYAITSKKDIAWQKRMIDEANSGILKLKKTSETCNDIILYAIRFLHRDLADGYLQCIKKYDENALTYDVMSYVLKSKELKEETILELLGDFRKCNLVNALGKYAKQLGYSSVLVALAL